METVYLVSAALLRDKALAGRVYACCPPARRARLEAVRDPEARLRSLAASAALMLALRDAGLQPEEAGLALTAAGKPYLPAQPGIHISLSHSGGLAVCAAGDRPLGVDIERPRTFRSSLLRRCFSEAERAAAEPLRLWVLKESFVKWTGEGLSDLPGSVLRFEGDAVSAPGTAAVFWDTVLPGGYRLALCGGGPDPLVPQLRTADRRDLGSITPAVPYFAGGHLGGKKESTGNSTWLKTSQGSESSEHAAASENSLVGTQ